MDGLAWWSDVSVLQTILVSGCGLLLLAATVFWMLVGGASDARLPSAAGGDSDAVRGRRSDHSGGFPFDPTDRIRVGLLLAQVVLSSDASRAYVANEASQRVSVVNTTTRPPIVIAEVPVGVGPLGLAVSPDGSLVYAPNNDDGTLSVIETAHHRVIATKNIGFRPRVAAFSPDGTRAYVTARGGSLSVFDTASHEIVGVLDLGGQPFGIVLTPDGNLAYVARRSAGTVAVIDTRAVVPTVVGQITVGEYPQILAMSPDASKIYVTNLHSGTVSVIDRATHSVAATIQVGDGPYWLAMAPDGERVYVANCHSNSISIIDATTDTLETSVKTPVDDPRGLAIIATPSANGSLDELMLLGTGGSSTLYRTSL